MDRALDRYFLPFFVGVVVVQGVHVFEHVIQLAQVYLLDVAEDDALGLLGYVFEFQGTEEWLHLAFNGTYLAALLLLVVPIWRHAPAAIPRSAFAVYLVGAVGLESWHVVEHIVIISNVVTNGGCPCPGIGDRALGVTDTQLHFVYNAVAYVATVVPFWFLAGASERKLHAVAAA